MAEEAGRELIRSKRKVEWGGLVVGQGEEAEPGGLTYNLNTWKVLGRKTVRASLGSIMKV